MYFQFTIQLLGQLLFLYLFLSASLRFTMFQLYQTSYQEETSIYASRLEPNSLHNTQHSFFLLCYALLCYGVLCLASACNIVPSVRSRFLMRCINVSECFVMLEIASWFFISSAINCHSCIWNAMNIHLRSLREKKREHLGMVILTENYSFPCV